MIAGVVLDDLHPADAPRCAELERLLFPGDDPWSERAFRDELAMGHRYRAARAGDLLVGYAGLAFVAGPPHPEAEVHTIGVRPDAQGSGLGRQLLRQLMSAADSRRLLLEVRTDNVAAIALYASEGFTTLGVRRRYYHSGADAYTMARPR